MRELASEGKRTRERAVGRNREREKGRKEGTGRKRENLRDGVDGERK